MVIVVLCFFFCCTAEPGVDEVFEVTQFMSIIRLVNACPSATKVRDWVARKICSK